jgi:heat shock protein HslJ
MFNSSLIMQMVIQSKIQNPMACRPLQPLSVSAIALLTGAVAITAVNPAIAQHHPTRSVPLQMAQSSALAGNWRLANMTSGGLPTPMLPVGELTADFASGKVSGSGGCNRFNGSYKTTGNQLKIGPLASTFKACEEGIMTQETRYFQALQAAQRYEVNNDGLQIFYKTDEGTGVLRFVSQTVRGLW